MCETRDATPEITDVFWYEIGNAVSEPMTSVSERTLDEILRPYGRALFVNNARNGGLYKLAKHAARQLSVASGNARTTPVSAINVTVLTTMPALQTNRPGIPTVPDGHLRSLDAQNKRLRSLASREGWVMADLASLSEELTPYYEDAIHVDIRGERLKAQAIATALEDAGVVERSDDAGVRPVEEQR